VIPKVQNGSFDPSHTHLGGKFFIPIERARHHLFVHKIWSA